MRTLQRLVLDLEIVFIIQNLRLDELLSCLVPTSKLAIAHGWKIEISCSTRSISGPVQQVFSVNGVDMNHVEVQSV
jgi:hypothetical protein